MINCSGGQEVANFKYFEKNGYGKRFRTAFMFNHYMKKISDNPSIIDKMRKNMNKNKNNEAMEKLYKIALQHLKDKK
jgi:UDP-N-acetylglucosamine:LPS N-acetylglucosamine transferase